MKIEVGCGEVGPLNTALPAVGSSIGDARPGRAQSAAAAQDSAIQAGRRRMGGPE